MNASFIRCNPAMKEVPPLIRTLAFVLTAAALLMMGLEKLRARRDRGRLLHVVHVNGIRGKSTVTRMIAAGLSGGGIRAFSKTTGTLPITIDPQGRAQVIKRRGGANIREQLRVLHAAAAAGAQVLVIECMAVDPELQRVSQREMLRADIGVITNVRPDHTDVMGNTPEAIADALSGTMPERGTVFTADTRAGERLRGNAKALGSNFRLVTPDAETPDIDFPENTALALAVCSHLGVPREAAAEGMRGFQRDPYALSLFQLPSGALFINAMSANDPESTRAVWERLKEKPALADRRMVLLINTRADRGYRAEQMAVLSRTLGIEEVWLLGAFQRPIARRVGDTAPVRRFRNAREIPLDRLMPRDAVFAVGNIASGGIKLMDRIQKEAKPFVS